jgi:hypothetical protein
VDGITTFQSGVPCSFQYSGSRNLFSGAGTPWGAGTARPDLLPGCTLHTSGSWSSKYQHQNFFNAACVVPPGTLLQFRTTSS